VRRAIGGGSFSTGPRLNKSGQPTAWHPGVNVSDLGFPAGTVIDVECTPTLPISLGLHLET
jgi:hypothetical protein